MPLTRAQFAGLTVRSVGTSIGWNNQPSTLRLELVQDPFTNDYPNPPDIGQPIFFQYGGFSFGGLLQKWSKKNAQDGLPTFEAQCIDPREILEGATIITGAYSGNTFGVRNLINAYGYLENLGYGLSGATPAGMPWNKIRSALLAICNQPNQTVYGGPLTYRGFAYSLDLSQLPNPPIYYRLPLPSIGLMEAIAQVCEDSGCDFFVDVVGFTIRIRTVSRFAQPPLGTITNLANTNTGNVIQSESGIEARNEITSAFLVGGEQTALHLGTDIVSFWGYDILGNPIIGESLEHEGTTGLHDFMQLNATGVSDLVQSTSYYCNTVEMRCALKSYQSWAAYIKRFKPELTSFVHSLNSKPIPNLKHKNDVIDDRRDAVLKAVDQDVYLKAQRLFEFVRGYGQEFYGVQYLVRIPFVLSKIDNETLQVTYSQEPTEAGYVAEGAQSLGLSALNEDVFKEADERFVCFAYYPTSAGYDTSRVDWNSTVIESDQSVYTRAQLDKRILFVGPLQTPAVHIQLSSALYAIPEDPYSSGPILNPAVTNPTVSFSQVQDKSLTGTVGSLGIWPEAQKPTVAAVPLKSNIATYGPWYIAGAPGKVRFEADSSLTPWDYGGYQFMNEAANARVLTTVTNMQVSESGGIELEGAPNFSLGDTMQTGGPNITNINMNISTQGVTTSYRFETYTPRFGQFSKANAERLKRMALANVELKRNIRKALNRAVSANLTATAALTGFLENAPKYVKRESPYDVMAAEVFDDNGETNPELTNQRVNAAALTYEEALAMSKADDDDAYKNIAFMSMGGLFAPYSLTPSGSAPSGNLLACFSYPDRGVIYGDTSQTISPFWQPLGAGITHPSELATTIEICASAPTYSGSNTRSGNLSPTGMKAIGLRSPLMMVGYGATEYAYNTPNSGSSANPESPPTWHAGPVDLAWDKARGVWSSRDLISGNVISGAGSGPYIVNIHNGASSGTSNWSISATNIFNGSIASGSKVICGRLINLPGSWVIVAADC